MALQKNYISVYITARKPDSSLITEDYRGKLGESRMGQSNFSFETFAQLRQEALAALVKEVAKRSKYGFTYPLKVRRSTHRRRTLTRRFTDA